MRFAVRNKAWVNRIDQLGTMKKGEGAVTSPATKTGLTGTPTAAGIS